MQRRSIRGTSLTTTTATIRGTIGRSKTCRSNQCGGGDAKPSIQRRGGVDQNGRQRCRANRARDCKSRGAKQLPRVSPDVFKQGMTVTHPEYGPGKIVALSGSGKNRRATIQFATVGQKKIILAHSAVRPAR